MQGALPCSAQQEGAQGGLGAPQLPAPLTPGSTNLAHTSQPHSRRSPAHFSMENIKGSVNQKKSPAGDQEILPCHAGLGSQLVPGGFCCNHEFGELEAELAFPVRHCRDGERKAQDQQMEKQEQNSLTGPFPGCQALLFPSEGRNPPSPSEFNWDGNTKPGGLRALSPSSMALSPVSEFELVPGLSPAQPLSHSSLRHRPVVSVISNSSCFKGMSLRAPAAAWDCNRKEGV